MNKEPIQKNKAVRCWHIFPWYVNTAWSRHRICVPFVRTTATAPNKAYHSHKDFIFIIMTRHPCSSRLRRIVAVVFFTFLILYFLTNLMLSSSHKHRAELHEDLDMMRKVNLSSIVVRKENYQTGDVDNKFADVPVTNVTSDVLISLTAGKLLFIRPKKKERLPFLVIGRLQNRCGDGFLCNFYLYIIFANTEIYTPMRKSRLKHSKAEIQSIQQFWPQLDIIS